MPVARGLQHRRAGQAAMGKQHRLVKAGTPGGHAPLYRYAGQRFETFQLLLGKGQRHQTGPRFGHMQAKLFGQPVAKGAGPHLRNRLAPGRHDHRSRPHQTARGFHDKPRALGPDRGGRAAQPQGDPGPLHVAAQHGDDPGGRAVTEQLPQRLFVPGDSGRINPRDEIPLGKAFERRQGKPGIARQKPLRRDPQIGKVAPPPARDADFLARRLGMVDQQHPPPAPPGLDRAHHARRPGPQNDDVCLIHAPCYPLHPGAATVCRTVELPLAATEWLR